MLAALFGLLVASGSALAAPLERRANIISQCAHDFSYTWDDGPYVYHQEIINKFNSRGGKTTFYINGDNWGCIYDDANVQAIRATFESGHQLASHTWSHADLQTLTHAQIDYEIQRMDEAFIKILGVKPRFLRPPYGSINDEVANYIEQTHGKTIVLWDEDSGDSLGGSAQDSYNFYNAFAQQGPGHPHLTLSHEVQEAGVDAMRMGSVDVLANAGITLLTTAQCLNAEPYIYYGGYGTRDSSWYCGNNGNWHPSNPQPTTTTTRTSTTTTRTSTTTTRTSTTTSRTSTSSNPAPSCISTYTSVVNDNCDNIGSRYGLTGAQILAANTFLNCNDIWVGTPICIPPGGNTSTRPTSTTTRTSTSTTPAPTCISRYTSVVNDNCDNIGSRYGLTGAQILAANTFLNCNDIWVGTSICIPPGGSTSTRPTSTTSRTSTSTTPAPSCIATYTSVANDNCNSIGAKYGLTGNQILNANTFLNCNDIWVGTPICIPPGGSIPTSTTTRTSSTSPSNPQPSCVQTYTSVANDTCQSIGTKFGLTDTAIKNANSFVTCNDIWAGTPICIPPGGSTCSFVYTSQVNDTCDTIGAKYGVSGDTIKSWNTFVTCNDIWVNTPITIKSC